MYSTRTYQLDSNSLNREVLSSDHNIYLSHKITRYIISHIFFFARFCSSSYISIIPRMGAESPGLASITAHVSSTGGFSRIARDGRGSRSKPDAQREVKVKHSMRWLLSQPLRWDENMFAVGRSKASSLKRHIQMEELGQSAPSRVKAVLEQIHIHVYTIKKNFN